MEKFSQAQELTNRMIAAVRKKYATKLSKKKFYEKLFEYSLLAQLCKVGDFDQALKLLNKRPEGISVLYIEDHNYDMKTIIKELIRNAVEAAKTDIAQAERYLSNASLVMDMRICSKEKQEALRNKIEEAREDIINGNALLESTHSSSSSGS